MTAPTPEAALFQFLSGFGLTAYAATSTPSDAEFPYLTYDLVVGDWDSGEVGIAVNLWYRTDSEKVPNSKVREIGREIGRGGTLVKCDGGTLWIKKGSPWAQSLRVEGEDEKVKRRYLNISVEYLISE